MYRDHRVISGSLDRANLVIPIPAFVESHSDGHAQPRFQSMAFRSQYKLTGNDELSADAMLSGGRFARQNTAFYSDLDADREVIGLFNQGNDQVWRNLSQNYTVAYHKTAGPSTTILSTELCYSNDNNSNNNNLFGELLQADTSTGSAMPPWDHIACPLYCTQFKPVAS